jgi:hypothetical protein
MVMIQLEGRVTETGELSVVIPKGFPSGKVRVIIETEGVSPINEPNSQPIFTEAELANLLVVEPKTGAEIVAAIQAGLLDEGWHDLDLTGEEWVENQRRQRRERSQW